MISKQRLGLLIADERIYAIAIAAFLTAACTPLIAPFDAIAYQNATSVKVEALSVMAEAKEPISNHRTQVNQVLLDVRKAREYAAHIPANQTTVKQWDDLNGYLFTQFFDQWEKGPLLPDAIEQRQIQAARAFDQIICLETNKREATTCPIKKESP